MSDLQKIIRDEFPRKKIMIVGDLVADQFLQGTITRVSREAPVFIMRHDQTQTLPGAAANAAVNVASLGGQAVLVGIVGSDDNGNALLGKLEEAKVDHKHIVRAAEMRTTTKIRVLAGQEHAARKQVIRIDYEPTPFLSSEIVKNIKENILAALNGGDGIDAIVISDYNYGVAAPEVIKTVNEAAREKGIPVIVDSRFRLSDFPGAASATPNQDEVEQIAGRRIADEKELAVFCAELREKLNYQALLVTRGNNGILLLEKNAPAVSLEAVGSKEPIDVTGAGDTVIAAYALGLASGLSFLDAAKVANHAGGVVVMKRRTASVSADELVAAIKVQSQTTSATL
ncbi:MAG TPA: PfkB family carbohydrate kinase [Pyrinomonadaceae bacterium]|jgi:rfaE bifunctional protein kinase chain/domain|nr:PfkB family carbohydrate kinase [Pyrinomonadaceae bacterium]